MLYMHVATSVNNLIHITVAALEAKHTPKTLTEAGIEVPYRSWVSLQFSPKNPVSAQALNYTCVLNLKHKVQQRTLRASSIDAHYVADAYKYMRSYGLWLQEQLEEANNKSCVISASCDDKCKVPPRFMRAPFPLCLCIRIHKLMLLHEVPHLVFVLLYRSMLESHHCPFNWQQEARHTLCLRVLIL